MVKRTPLKEQDTGKQAVTLENGHCCSHLLQEIIDSLDDSLIVVGRDYRVVHVNRTALMQLGKDYNDIVGQDCQGIKKCHSPGNCPTRLAFATGKQVRAPACAQPADGQQFTEVIASPIIDYKGEVIAVAELSRDLTPLRELERELAEAQRRHLALSRIISVINQSLDLDAVLSSALDETLDIIKVNSGSIMLLDEEGQVLHCRVHRDLYKDVSPACCKLGEGIAGRAALSGNAILIEDIQAEPLAARLGRITTEGIRGYASFPLRSKGKVLGVLNIATTSVRQFSPDDIQLLESITAQVAVAIERAKLHQEAQHQDKIRGELLQDIFSIQEEERRRIARELHDEASQILASLTASLEAAAGMLSPRAEKTRAMLRKAQALSINILDEIHKLIYQLRPTLLDDMGLVAATRWLVDNNLKATGIKVTFKTSGRKKRLPPRLETTLFRVIQEAVYNIARHSRASSTSLSLHFKKNTISVHIADDGRGFDVLEAISTKDRPRGLGLLGMRERVELVSGTLDIRSQPGGGTEICIDIPLNQEVDDG